MSAGELQSECRVKLEEILASLRASSRELALPYAAEWACLQAVFDLVYEETTYDEENVQIERSEAYQQIDSWAQARSLVTDRPTQFYLQIMRQMFEEMRGRVVPARRFTPSSPEDEELGRS